VGDDDDDDGGGNNNGNDDGNPSDDDSILEPEPEVCSSSMCNPNLTWPFPTGTPPPVTQSSFWQGAALFAVGAILAIGGGFLMGVAIAEVLGGVATGPFEALVVLHALAVGSAGLGFALIGAVTMRKGYEIMKSSPTP
jgi:hypothetical protein